MDPRAIVAEAQLCDMRRRLSQMVIELSAMRPAFDFNAACSIMLAESELRSVIARGKPYAAPTLVATWPFGNEPKKA